MIDTAWLNSLAIVLGKSSWHRETNTTWCCLYVKSKLKKISNLSKEVKRNDYQRAEMNRKCSAKQIRNSVRPEICCTSWWLQLTAFILWTLYKKAWEESRCLSVLVTNKAKTEEIYMFRSLTYLRCNISIIFEYAMYVPGCPLQITWVVH